MPEIPWPIAISWIVTIAGWWFVASRASQRAEASEVFQMLNAAEELVEQVRSDAVRLYLLDATEAEVKGLNLEISAKSQRLSRKLTALRKRSGHLDVMKWFITFKRVTSGGNAESVRRRALEEGDEYFKFIDDAAEKLIEALHDGYNTAYNRGTLF